MAPPQQITQLFDKIDSLKPQFIQRLAEAVEIPSVSADAAHRPKVVEMAKWMEKQLASLGATDIQLKELELKKVLRTCTCHPLF